METLLVNKQKSGQNSRINAFELQNELENRLKELAIETDKVQQSEFFKNYLEIMSKFWNYSYHNQLLIFFQNKNAERVAGFVKWKEVGRRIKKGSKAIKILAPYVKKAKALDPDTHELMEEEIRFFPVNVFDV